MAYPGLEIRAPEMLKYQRKLYIHTGLPAELKCGMFFIVNNA